MDSRESSSAAPSAVHDALRSTGQPLPFETRAEMEHYFGRDFSGVRVHTGATAARSAQAVNAFAYTVGNHMVFDMGRYAPQSPSGRRLLAHELTHVAQQSAGSSTSGRIRMDSDPRLEAEAGQAELGAFPRITSSTGPALQAKGKGSATGPGMCSAPWTCAASPCDKPDPGSVGSGATPTEWTLKVHIDTEAPTPEEVGTNTYGHTYVEFNDSSGASWTFGFYPDKAVGTPDPMFKPAVPGCMVHPDLSHKNCVDYTETFKLTQTEYQAALDFAILMCKAPTSYNVTTFNCTTFVDHVVKKAGKSLPPIRGKVGRTVTADNPNTLLEGLKDRDVPSRHAKSDTEIRMWVSTNKAEVIAALPVAEKIRLINRLIDGYVAEGDIGAVETICKAVTTALEMKTIRDAVGKRESELNKAQGSRFHAALNRI